MLNVKNIVPNTDVLKESYDVDDLLGFDDHIIKLSNKVNASPDVSIFGIVGAFGTGKSVLLQKYKETLEENSIWVHFDAWKYPERKNLWDGFVLDFAYATTRKEFKKAKKIIDGKQGSLLKGIKVLGSVAGTAQPGLSSLTEKLTSFMQRSPVIRVFEFQNILEKIIHTQKEDIYITIEDADRSGNEGLFFIETLSQYFRNLDPRGKKITVFVLLSKNAYLDNEKRDSFIKSLDYIEHYDLTVKQINNFLSSVLDKRILEDDIAFDHMTEWSKHILSRGVTIRTYKTILRNANLNYKRYLKQGFSPDPRIVFMIESTKYLYEGSNPGESIFESIKQDNAIRSETDRSKTLLYLLIAINKHESYQNIQELVRTLRMGTIRIIFTEDEYSVNETTHTILPQFTININEQQRGQPINGNIGFIHKFYLD